MAEIGILVAFLAGLVSFLSPCVLPLIPAYLTFLAGTTLEQAKTAADYLKARRQIFLSSAFFVLGFSVIFSVLGVALQSVLSAYAYDLKNYLGYVGGLVIIFFGLLLLGVVKIEALQKEHRLRVQKTGNAYLSSFVFGAAFAVGWTPCVGAVLGGILTLAVTNPTAALPILLSYSLGLGLPFLLVGAFISQSSAAIAFITPHLKWLNVVFGLVLVFLGVLVFTNTLSLIANLGFVNDMLLQ